jgi:urocanate hydratase
VKKTRRLCREIDGGRWRGTSKAMLPLKRAGAVAFDYGNNIRKQAFDAGL